MINIIVATDKNGVISKEGQIPWHCKSDFKHFKETTMGFPLIMGRKTFESLPGILPGRQHIVMTRDASYTTLDEIIVCNSYTDAIERAMQISNTVFVIGGAQIYQEAMSCRKYPVDNIYQSVIDIEIEQDESCLFFFPKDGFFIVESESREDFNLLTLRRLT